MNDSNYKPSVFGVQCDAITGSGSRCTKRNVWEMNCTAVYDARCNSYQADHFRPVRLCSCHMNLEFKLRKQGKRLKLHHGGWLGAFNRYQFGNLVINRPVVNWDKVKSLKVPKFWRNEV